jgi:hypothetical protein
MMVPAARRAAWKSEKERERERNRRRKEVGRDGKAGEK